MIITMTTAQINSSTIEMGTHRKYFLLNLEIGLYAHPPLQQNVKSMTIFELTKNNDILF